MSLPLTDWLIANYGREDMKKETGLGRIREALDSLGLLSELNQKTIVTIAGTNGKGETTLWLSRELKGRRHCVWISPHVERITERFRSEEGEISETELFTHVNECHALVQERGVHLTYYEFLFLVFCHWARRKNPEALLLEVGLGGRLDAVNVFDAKLILLPSISRDHQEFLGHRYDLILGEKLGLLRQGTTLLSFLHLQYLRERARAHCQMVGAKFIDLEEKKLAAKWEFSVRNQLLARAAYLFLEGKELNSLRDFVSHGQFLEHRGELWKEGREWIFYGSHNVDGMRNLILFLQSGNYTFQRPPFDAVLVSFSRREQRDLRVMMRMLKGSGMGRILVASFPHPKAATRMEMESLAASEGITFVQNLDEYIQTAVPGTRVLVAGSYYFLGYVKSLLRSR